MLGRVCMSAPGMTFSADLGGSSNYSAGMAEHQCGEGFRDNGEQSRISRS